ncbi:exported hypothetical protein [Candidatus Sulfotelmatomonas gaucii]|uniref:Uncharacterized protein n=1 Tax=Candidatus Sulfuritelmatomonas gaucii TaxID=2043161 RepID=A0A2N9LQU1_9BACT|nr:exported hypothetical protein [Candidatus Sulfotelmatomonas gaucii]
MAQQSRKQLPAAIWFAMGQSAPMPLMAIGQPGAQFACIPAVQGNPAIAGKTATRQTIKMATNWVCCLTS